MIRIFCTLLITEKNGITVTDVKTGITAQGKTYSIALSNIKEALNLYYKDIPKEFVMFPIYSDMKKWKCVSHQGN